MSERLTKTRDNQEKTNSPFNADIYRFRLSKSLKTRHPSHPKDIPKTQRLASEIISSLKSIPAKSPRHTTPKKKEVFSTHRHAHQMASRSTFYRHHRGHTRKPYFFSRFPFLFSLAEKQNKVSFEDIDARR